METVSQALGYRPPALLAGLVDGVGYEQRGYPSGVHQGLPSCAVTFVIPLETTLDLRVGPDGRPVTLTSCVGGMHTAPVSIGHEGTQVGVQLAVTPAGARVLFDRPAADLAAVVVELDELWGADGRELLDRLHAAPSWPARFAVLDELLTRRAADRDEALAGVPAEVAQAWRRLSSGRPGTSVAAVADEVGWSRRHLGQRFVAEVGVTPKTAGRIARFQHAAEHLKRRPHEALAVVAATTGYADQAHMTREWRELAGHPPAAWLREEVLPFLQDETTVAA